ncbi:tRNA (cmo5U34)-methyltransferase [Pedobacter psychrotolerans]|uniref:SAM-dependent methyltransferase n=1 Tax=Pedobacter psychrotolerans TaxID=1843235 RepID=A0A4V2S083_9SPHI|nr:class I SAM-dependent methyltransferase [Pedobacter psychrotolerans]TCO30666.1 tRNA (cmo5U34)-methyltransferase [Pedobacter psychrotolerans]GGE68436.1 SAM-dependent methyltransferase [Pedobacter psychrotolerans]
METLQEIQNQFNAVSEKYDWQRQFLIPCFNDFYKTALTLSEEVSIVKNILDVGAGTGLMSAFFHEKYPEAKITLVDISSAMLKKAEERFEGNENINFLNADFATVDLPENHYDLVVSGLAIHHLPDELKQQLFIKIAKTLKSGGWFINADQVLGGTDLAEKIYTENWKNHVAQNPNLTEEEKHSAFERIKVDIMAPLKPQLEWLENAGLQNANCYYQYYNFVVFAANK